ncbi:protein phosphatase 2C domain-containing protein [Niveibacterium sp. 24ML]|uniref:PP2C family protein-serine/threonine phosphatase n=1 Tax=Niveibacterium sp. 24ML TaxID=2985512 RepID=UPI00226DAD20|nr:protein phosphatase 2C domain-containing protein [Niveibacterium sp. 24ML]MCX9156600.1 protein phosphatase 2C domain-containing protein [Niveibacterium sp. 24ML]
MLELETAYFSDQGGRTRNEDACGYWSSDTGACWVVSDGAGGHGSGDVASRLVVSRILEWFSANPVVGSDRAVELLRGANDAVINAKRSGVTKDDMHATVALLMIDRARNEAIWGHAGDTRIYLFRDGAVAYCTRDHSLVQNLIDAGYGSTDMIRSHPQRSLLTSAIGSAESIELSVAGTPLQILSGDVFLMCTDGWWEYVDEQEMTRMLAQSSSPQHWLQLMSDSLRAKVSSGNDNFTAICVVVGSSDPRTTIIMPDENLGD